jgi:REP element-mobilizing transposase RayT
LRIEYPGAIYHILSRGNRRQAIFLDDGDRHDFLKTLGEACQKARFEVHAYCLMHNHFHLVAETPDGNLVAGMRWLLSTYSNRFNHRHQLCGHVFSGRYKALLVEGDGGGYLRTVCDYTHLNPVRAGLLKRENRLLEYPWSSLGCYLSEMKHRPKWLRVDRLLGEHGILKDTAAGRRELENRLETRREQEGDPRQWKGPGRGWYVGSQTFRRKLLKRAQEKVGSNHPGATRKEAAHERAEAIIAKELRRKRWSEGELAKRPKTDAAKVAIAARLRRETTMAVEEIARRLRMGTRNTLSAKLKQWKRTHESIN